MAVYEPEHYKPRMILSDYAKLSVTPGFSGSWSVSLRHNAPRAHNALDHRHECFHYEGGVARELKCNGVTVMSDDRYEWWTQREAIMRARSVGGDVLITGLGLGVVVEAIMAPLSPASVRSVTVLEKSPDVIALVGANLYRQFGKRVQIIEADAYTWVSANGQMFDVVWHDIWADPSAPEVDVQIEALRTHHQAWSRWQGFWPINYRAELYGITTTSE